MTFTDQNGQQEWQELQKRAEQAEARAEALKQLLREAIDGHIYGNDSEQWLLKADAAG